MSKYSFGVVFLHNILIPSYKTQPNQLKLKGNEDRSAASQTKLYAVNRQPSTVNRQKNDKS